jgi:outer membrane protein TolC
VPLPRDNRGGVAGRGSAVRGSNLTLLAAGTKVLQARAALGIAVGFEHPQLQQGTGSLIYNRTSAATFLAATNSRPALFWTDALAVQAAWELDFWGKFRRGVESARRRAKFTSGGVLMPGAGT